MRTWRPSLPGTTRPSGRPSSGRYNCVMWDKWHQYKSTLSELLWYSIHPHPAGVCHSHGSAACHSSHCWSLLILVTTLLAKFLFFTTLIKTWFESIELLSPQRTCEVFYSDSSWLVHGILVSENTSRYGVTFFYFCIKFCLIISPFFFWQSHVLCHLHCTILLWRAEVMFLCNKPYNTNIHA